MTVMSEQGIGRLGWWLFMLGLAALAWQSGPLAWRIWLGPEPLSSVALMTAPAAARTQANYPLWNLFGRPAALVSSPAAALENAPETRLQLDLYGVLVGADGTGSGAIVAERGKEANYFRLDAILPGNARLAAVYPDKIVLERAGVMESLSFDDADKGSSSTIQQVAKPVVNTTEDFMALAQQRLLNDAGGALGSVGLEPAAGASGPAGYVFNGNNPMLSSLSLEKGDVIRSVNGHVLGDVEQDRAMLQQLYDSGMLEVEVERDGAIFSISYPLR